MSYQGVRSARRILLFTFAAGLVAFTQDAQADGVGAKARATLKAACERFGTPHRLRTTGRSKKIVMNITSAEHQRARDALAKPGTNVLEICHSFGSGQHSLATFEGRPVHFQYRTGEGGKLWRMNNWGALRNTASGTHGVMIQLTKREGDNLRRMIDLAEREQNQHQYLQTAFGGRTGDCSTKWVNAKIGENGETLAQICETSGWAPRGFQRSLETSTSERVFGVWIKDGPHAANFGATEGQDLFR